MSTLRCLLMSPVALATLLVLATAPAAAAAVDQYGDPLPDGVLARLGTLRFSHPAPAVWQRPIAISPDGKHIASAGYSFVPKLKPTANTATTEKRTSVRLWDRATGKLLLEILFAPKSIVCDLKFSPDSRHLAINHDLNEIVLVELKSGCDKQTGNSALRHSLRQFTFLQMGKVLPVALSRGRSRNGRSRRLASPQRFGIRYLSRRDHRCRC